MPGRLVFVWLREYYSLCQHSVVTTDEKGKSFTFVNIVYTGNSKHNVPPAGKGGF